MIRLPANKIAVRLIAILVLALGVAGVVPRVLAQDEAVRLKIIVNAKCEGPDAVFELFNEGELWPIMARISVYRTDTQTIVSSRQMRMMVGQKMAYKAKGSTEEKIEFGLWVEPLWYERSFSYDAVIACG